MDGCNNLRLVDRETVIDFYNVTSAFEAWLSNLYLLQTGHKIEVCQSEALNWPAGSTTKGTEF